MSSSIYLRDDDLPLEPLLEEEPAEGPEEDDPDEEPYPDELDLPIPLLEREVDISSASSSISL